MQSKVSVTMDTQGTDGSMPSANITIEASDKVLAYAAMSAAIVMFAKRHSVEPQAVHYSASWQGEA
jgi:hypothetical protein